MILPFSSLGSSSPARSWSCRSATSRECSDRGMDLEVSLLTHASSRSSSPSSPAWTGITAAPMCSEDSSRRRRCTWGPSDTGWPHWQPPPRILTPAAGTSWCHGAARSWLGWQAATCGHASQLCRDCWSAQSRTCTCPTPTSPPWSSSPRSWWPCPPPSSSPRTCCSCSTHLSFNRVQTRRLDKASRIHVSTTCSSYDYTPDSFLWVSCISGTTSY